jgi:hypothetical protein
MGNYNVKYQIGFEKSGTNFSGMELKVQEVATGGVESYRALSLYKMEGSLL